MNYSFKIIKFWRCVNILWHFSDSEIQSQKFWRGNLNTTTHKEKRHKLLFLLLILILYFGGKLCEYKFSIGINCHIKILVISLIFYKCK